MSAQNSTQHLPSPPQKVQPSRGCAVDRGSLLHMNAGTSTPAREVGIALLVFALGWLFKEDDRWRPVPSPVGATITLTRRWQDATTDTIAMSPDITYAMREDPEGQHVDWISGTAVSVVSAVGGWPAPSQPSGPQGSGRVSVLSGVRP